MILLLCLGLAQELASEGFVSIGANRGVTVYHRDRDGGIQLAAEARLEAPPEQVQRVLVDYANHPRWVHGLGESRVVERAPGSLYVYQRLDLLLLRNRDFTLHVTFGEDGGARWIRFVAANDRGPPPSRHLVRVSLHEGSWRLEPLDGGRATRAIYRFHLDLAGAFPSWLGRGHAEKGLVGFFDRLRDQLQYYR
jgi:uncharacterized protein YndB with AHSA1/START domain